MTKSQKELMMLGIFAAATLGVLIYYFIQSSRESAPVPYQAKPVNTDFSTGLFNHPAYAKLSAPIHLPVEPGTLGRDNPFADLE